MKKYTKPEIKIIFFETENILTQSTTLPNNGFTLGTIPYSDLSTDISDSL